MKAIKFLTTGFEAGNRFLIRQLILTLKWFIGELKNHFNM